MLYQKQVRLCGLAAVGLRADLCAFRLTLYWHVPDDTYSVQMVVRGEHKLSPSGLSLDDCADYIVHVIPVALRQPF